ncbi:hypothetical protein BDK51DRAFT_32722 [Blyttiomyces helicus]|uniref:Uncharacterized protein n=1 Tax=Blyttiomyces helicus TaxID=388810 RepID=A0A4P9W2P2_9FUNG|nr:hypothetical protein BDK51DRAFT_32722 [Blyttiomyces helicus]|eukprot:RKO84870.1 hypothetical protein BDK51DRAFT_32722 [Blyttiomyces helicus]
MLLWDICNVSPLYSPQSLLQRSRSAYPKAMSSVWNSIKHLAPPSSARDMRVQAVAGHAGTCENPDSGRGMSSTIKGSMGRLLFPRLGCNKIMNSRGLETRARSSQAVDVIFSMRDGDDSVRAQWVANSGGPPYNINLERAFSDWPCQQSNRGEFQSWAKLCTVSTGKDVGPSACTPFIGRLPTASAPPITEPTSFPEKYLICEKFPDVTQGAAVLSATTAMEVLAEGREAVRGGGKPELEVCSSSSV